MKRAVIAAVVVCLLPLGCVKEDRMGCPCYLTLNFDRVITEDGYFEAVTTLTPCSDRAQDQEKINIWDYEGVGYEKKVVKDQVRASVVCGFKNGSFRDDSYIVPKSVQCDPIMAFALSKRCEGERETAEVELHKQFCRIHFRFVGLGSRSEYPYELRVRADCCGLRLFDLQPVEGEYTAIAVETNSGDLSVVLPRQKVNAVALDLLDAKAQVAQTVDLGARMEAMGYDWAKADLDDIVVEIDYTLANVETEIIPWDTTYETIDI